MIEARTAPKVGVRVERIPRHVGVITDGNGRWAQGHGLPRIEGHRRGVEALRRTVRLRSNSASIT